MISSNFMILTDDTFIHLILNILMDYFILWTMKMTPILLERQWMNFKLEIDLVN